MGKQRMVTLGEELPEEIGSPIAEHHSKRKEREKAAQAKKAESTTPAKEEIAQAETVKEPPKKAARRKTKVRSKRYHQSSAQIDRQKIYGAGEALDLVKKTSLSRFDGNIEVHIRLLSKTGKPENLRGLIQYPHPTGKKIHVEIIDEKLIDKIAKSGKEEAAFRHAIYLATPEIMPKVAKLAKILGPKGKMPNPKSGTITDNPEKTKKELEGGKLEYKTDTYGIIHQVIGKVSVDNKTLEDNLRALLAVLPADKIASITLCATMGPGVKVQV